MKWSAGFGRLWSDSSVVRASDIFSLPVTTVKSYAEKNKHIRGD